MAGLAVAALAAALALQRANGPEGVRVTASAASDDSAAAAPAAAAGAPGVRPATSPVPETTMAAAAAAAGAATSPTIEPAVPPLAGTSATLDPDPTTTSDGDTIPLVETGQPVATNTLEGRAALAFGDRYAGIHYPIDPTGPGFLTPIIYVKGAGTSVPASFEGSVVEPVELSLARDRVAPALPQLEERGVTVSSWGIEPSANAVVLGLPAVTDQAREAVASVLGDGPYRLIQRGGGMTSPGPGI